MNLKYEHNFMARYCHNCPILEGVSFNQHEKFQTVSAYEFNFLNLLQKSTFCPI